MTGSAEDVLLIVDDNPSDLELTVRALHRTGFKGQMVFAKDGAEALHYLFGADDSQPMGKAPKIVLLDLKLPKVSGLEVLGKIRSDARTQNYTVVILTSSREDRDIKKAYGLGANSYIVKPVGFDQFSSTVSALGRYWLFLNQIPPFCPPHAAPSRRSISAA